MAGVVRFDEWSGEHQKGQTAPVPLMQFYAGFRESITD